MIDRANHVPGVGRWRDGKTGRWYARHRKTGAMIDLAAFPWKSARFLLEVARLDAKVAATPESRPGTLGMLKTIYQGDDAFLELADRTRRDYLHCLDFLKPIDDTLLKRFDRALVVNIRDAARKKHGRRFGNYVKAVLSIIFAWGVERGHLAANPAEKVRNIRRPKGAPRANRAWADEERFAVIDAAPWSLKVPIALAMFTALREGDALAATKAAYDGATIEVITGKTRQRVRWPAPAALRRILDQAPAHTAVTLAATSRGRPWTASGFRASWRTFRLRLEAEGRVAPGLTIHGLRHTVATIMREEGFDLRTIADALGQKTEAMAGHYASEADLDRKMTGVVRRLDRAENKRRSNLSNLAGRRVKSAPDGGSAT
ncbi:MAG: tyrosine-type recombinase/integrase [Bauldia sp.]|nr:tyrosine-type recombinase/integrase [Bauldia sp.]